MALTDREKAERFKSAAESAGYKIEKIEGLNYAAYSIWDFWLYLSNKYMGIDWDGKGDVNTGISLLAEDLNETHSIKVNVFRNGNEFLIPTGINYPAYLSPWFSTSDYIKLDYLEPISVGSYIVRWEPRQVVLGYVGTSIERSATDRMMHAYIWAMRNNDVVILESIPIPGFISASITLNRWRLRVKTFPQFNYNCEFDYEFYYDYERTYTDEHGHTRTIIEHDNHSWVTFLAGRLPQEDEATVVFQIVPPSMYDRHIGDDIKSVTSISGGHGANASSPSATKNVIGQGGNGGHGGGGGGAAGTKKTENIVEIGNKVLRHSFDLAGGMGTMSAGTGGTGTDGTAGHRGGCVIYY